MGYCTKFRTRSSLIHKRKEHGRALLVAMAVVTLAHVGILAGIWRESSPARGASSDRDDPKLVEAIMLPAEKRAPVLPTRIERTQPPSRQASMPTRPSRAVGPAANAVKDHELSALAPAPETNNSSDAFSTATLSTVANDSPNEAFTAPNVDKVTAEHADELAIETGIATPIADSRSIDLPASSQLQYDVAGTSRGFNYSAHATINWQRDGGRYAIEMRLHAFLLGSRSQVSAGLVTPTGLQPESFVDKARRERRLLFDWSQKTAHADDLGAPIAIPDHTQDRLSVFFQLAAKLAAHRLDISSARQNQWNIPVAGWNGVETWSFKIQDIGQSEFPFGTLETWQASRLPRPGKQNDQNIDVWYAPSLDFLPVRIKITQNNGDTVDQRLSRR